MAFPHDEKRYGCRGLVSLVLPESWSEVMPADMCCAFVYLFNAKLLPSSWFTSHTVILSASKILLLLRRK